MKYFQICVGSRQLYLKRLMSHVLWICLILLQLTNFWCVTSNFIVELKVCKKISVGLLSFATCWTTIVCDTRVFTQWGNWIITSYWSSTLRPLAEVPVVLTWTISSYQSGRLSRLIFYLKYTFCHIASELIHHKYCREL